MSSLILLKAVSCCGNQSNTESCWQVRRLCNGPLHVLAVYCLTVVDALGIGTSLHCGYALSRLHRLIHRPDICVCHGLIHRICSPWYAPVSVFFFLLFGHNALLLLCFCCLSCQLVCPFVQCSNIYQLSGLMFHWGVWSVFFFICSHHYPVAE